MEEKEGNKMAREKPGWKDPGRFNVRGSRENGKFRLRLYDVLCQ